MTDEELVELFKRRAAELPKDVSLYQQMKNQDALLREIYGDRVVIWPGIYVDWSDPAILARMQAGTSLCERDDDAFS